MFKDDEYKLDLIDGLEDGNITCYEQGDFTDLCRGPHVENVKLCRNFKLIRHSGAILEGRQQEQGAAENLRCMFPDTGRAGRALKTV